MKFELKLFIGIYGIEIFNWNKGKSKRTYRVSCKSLIFMVGTVRLELTTSTVSR